MLLSRLSRRRLLMFLAQVEDVTGVAIAANTFTLSTRRLVLGATEDIAKVGI